MVGSKPSKRKITAENTRYRTKMIHQVVKKKRAYPSEADESEDATSNRVFLADGKKKQIIAGKKVDDDEEMQIGCERERIF